MGEKTKIEWCDATWNPWEGCSKVSPGCANCYAEARNHRYGMDNWGKGKPRRRTSAANWKKPLKWNRYATCSCDSGDTLVGGFCNYCGERTRSPRVFCASLADWLDDEVPIEWLADLLKLIHDTPNLDWLLLTKRPGNWHERINGAAQHLDRTGHIDIASRVYWWTDISGSGIPPANVWIGTTVENQEFADKRIPELLKIPAKVRFLSCEPLLGPVDIEDYLDDIVDGGYVLGSAPIHWVIAGGESGPNARPMNPGWSKSLRDQCQAACVPFFFKQWGEWSPNGDEKNWTPKTPLHQFPIETPTEFARFCPVYRVGKKAAGRLLDGKEWSEFPNP